MEFAENEAIRFQHPATFRGKEGLVSVTNLRIFFSAHSGNAADNQSFTWANVKSVEYSPANDPQGRAMCRIGTVLEEKKHLIQFVHADPKARFAALEQMKAIISDIRKPGSSSVASAPAAAPAASSSQPAAAHSQRNNGQASRIGKEYDWSFDSKGRANSLINNISTVQKDGKTVLHLTADAKALVFERFPAVKKAFAAEVPLKMSEQAFWTSFFNSQYFSRPQDCEAVNSDRKLFARYELSSSTSKPASAGTAAGTLTGSKRLRELTELDVDLTASNEMSLPSSDPTTSTMASLEQQAQLPYWVNADSEAILSSEKAEMKHYLHKLHLLGGMRPGEEIALGSDSADGRHAFIPLHLSSSDAASQAKEVDQTVSASTEALLQVRVHPFHAAECLASLPSSQRAKKLVDTEVNRVLRNAHLANGHVEGGDQSLESLRYLDASSRQDLRETFNQVTELLRHYYACTRSAEKTAAGTNASKMGGIIQRLGEIAHRLETKKGQLSRSNSGSQDPQHLAREQLMPIWQMMLVMIQRARTDWSTLSTN